MSELNNANRFLNLKQIDEIAPDFSDTTEFMEDLIEKINFIKDELIEELQYIHDTKIKKSIPAIEEFEKQIKTRLTELTQDIETKTNETYTKETQIIEEIEHTAICNEIYNNLEMTKRHQQ